MDFFLYFERMAAKLKIKMTADDFRELSRELHRLAEVAVATADDISGDDPEGWEVVGINQAIEGLGSVAIVCSQILGIKKSPKPQLQNIRNKLKATQQKELAKEGDASEEQQAKENDRSSRKEIKLKVPRSDKSK